jgi:hypothetical protein
MIPLKVFGLESIAGVTVLNALVAVLTDSAGHNF